MALAGRKNPSTKTRISDYGLTWDQSSKYQRIAELPEDVFEEAGVLARS